MNKQQPSLIVETPDIIFNMGFHSKQPPSGWKAEDKAKYLSDRDFYACKQDGQNIIDYYQRLDIEKLAKQRKSYSKSLERNIMDYMKRESAQEKGKMALFNGGGELSFLQREQLKKSLRETDSIIWHSVVSFSKEYGEGKMNTAEKAKAFIDSQFKRFIGQTHLDPKNIEYAACYHNDTKNYHVHFTFFEKEPKTVDRNGAVSYTKKGCLQKSAILNSLLNFEEYFSENKADIFSARDNLIEGERKSLTELGENSYLFVKLESLSKRLPESGRLSYSSANMKGHMADVDELVDNLITTNPKIQTAYTEYISAVNERQQRYEQYAAKNKLKEGELDLNQFTNLRQDIRARMGNSMIKAAVEIRSYAKKAERLIAAATKSAPVNSVNKRKKEFTMRKRYGKTFARKALRYLKKVINNMNTTDYFLEFRQKVQELQREAESVAQR